MRVFLLNKTVGVFMVLASLLMSGPVMSEPESGGEVKMTDGGKGELALFIACMSKNPGSIILVSREKIVAAVFLETAEEDEKRDCVSRAKFKTIYDVINAANKQFPCVDNGKYGCWL
ncbi:MAG: hypothetical protein ABW161_01160 [Candidatus Thiodiazotropha sp.]